jgi:ribose-phosphate pyrophosphokinase
MMQRNYSQVVAEAEPPAKKEDPYTRSRAKELMKNHEDAVIIGGQSNHKLAEGVAAYLGASLAKSEVRRFADGETSIKISDNVNGKHIYIVQPTCPPVNDSLMELLLTISACKRAGAATVTCIVPYYGYARQDRKF